MSAPKEAWSSRLGVILAVAGSAVGLGNFLRFPGLAAQYGGGAFMIAYAISFLIIGLPIGWAEWAMGRYAGQLGYNSCPGAFASITRSRWAKYAGIIGVMVPVMIYMYYVVIESWCLGYAINFWRGDLAPTAAAASGQIFQTFTGSSADGSALALSWGTALPWLVGVFVFNFWLIYRGLSKGIEKMCNLGMPLLIVLAVILLVRVLTLGAPDPTRPNDTVVAGLGYLWNPTKINVVPTDPNSDVKPYEVVGSGGLAEAKATVAASGGKLELQEVDVVTQLKNPKLWLSAASQIFFSLSVGFGVIIVYSSYMGKHDDVVLSGLTASSANEFCEVGLGGLISVPAAVAFLGVASVAGQGTFGLGFNVLPLVFGKMPAGAFFGGAFFFMLFLAAVTSSISMLQPGIAFLEEAMNIGRKMSVTVLGLLTCIGSGFVLYFSKDLKALDTIDFWVGTFLIFVLATIQIIIFGWIWGIDKGFDQLNQGAAIRVPRFFRFIMKWVCPAFLLTVFAMWFLDSILGFDLKTLKWGAVAGYVTDLSTNLAAQLSVTFILIVATFFFLITARSHAYQRAEQGLPKHD